MHRIGYADDFLISSRSTSLTPAAKLRVLRLTAIKTTNNPVNPVRLDDSTNHEELLNLSAVVL